MTPSQLASCGALAMSWRPVHRFQRSRVGGFGQLDAEIVAFKTRAQSTHARLSQRLVIAPDSAVRRRSKVEKVQAPRAFDSSHSVLRRNHDVRPTCLSPEFPFSRPAPVEARAVTVRWYGCLIALAVLVGLVLPHASASPRQSSGVMPICSIPCRAAVLGAAFITGPGVRSNQLKVDAWDLEAAIAIHGA